MLLRDLSDQAKKQPSVSGIESTGGRPMEQVIQDAKRIEAEFAAANRTATVRVDDLGRLVQLAYGGFGVADLDSDDHGLLSRIKAATNEAER